MNRRALLGRVVAGLMVLAGAASCRKKVLVCTDPTGLTPDEVQVRTALQYLDATPLPDRACTACTLYVPTPEADTCGTCKVVHGPIHPNGTCKAFLRKPEGGAPT